jgi:hypothetical protein
MRWQYKIVFAEGNSGICPTPDRVWDCLAHFRNKFGTARVLSVAERFGSGDWVPSELLPLSQEEADGIK